MILRIKDFIAKNPNASRKAVADHFGISKASATYWLQDMVKYGHLKETSLGYTFGGAFGGYTYTVIERCPTCNHTV